MQDLGNSSAVRATDTTGSAPRQDAYQRYAAPMYRQALLTLGDSVLAEQVVREVFTEEFPPEPGPGTREDDARYRLAESVFRRCQRLSADLAQRNRRPARRPLWHVADCVDPGRLLSEHERGAVGLVLFGGLDYVRASTVLGIDPRDLAILLRTVLRRLTAGT